MKDKADDPANTKPEKHGSYPAEITLEQLAWLQARAAERRRQWQAPVDEGKDHE